MNLQEANEILQELYEKGEIVKKLDDRGQPMLREFHQVFVHPEYATPEELAFWRSEHPGQLVAASWSRPGAFRTAASWSRREAFRTVEEP